MVLDGIVLCGKAKCVPAHGVQYVIALHPALSGHNIQGGVGTGMAHMKALSRRIGELHQRIIFGLGIIVRGGKRLLRRPDPLPFLLDLFGVVHFFHSYLTFCRINGFPVQTNKPFLSGTGGSVLPLRRDERAFISVVPLCFMWSPTCSYPVCNGTNRPPLLFLSGTGGSVLPLRRDERAFISVVPLCFMWSPTCSYPVCNGTNRPPLLTPSRPPALTGRNTKKEAALAKGAKRPVRRTALPPHTTRRLSENARALTISSLSLRFCIMRLSAAYRLLL